MKQPRLLIGFVIIAFVVGITLILIGLMPAPTTNGSTNRMVAQAGNLKVQLAMTPAPAAFSTTTFDITITDEKGAPVSDAIVSLDLTMPSMYMPANRPRAQALGDGKYRATGRFTMRGGWQIAVMIERGGQRQTAIFQLGL